MLNSFIKLSNITQNKDDYHWSSLHLSQGKHTFVTNLINHAISFFHCSKSIFMLKNVSFLDEQIRFSSEKE